MNDLRCTYCGGRLDIDMETVARDPAKWITYPDLYSAPGRS